MIKGWKKVWECVVSNTVCYIRLHMVWCLGEYKGNHRGVKTRVVKNTQDYQNGKHN